MVGDYSDEYDAAYFVIQISDTSNGEYGISELIVVDDYDITYGSGQTYDTDEYAVVTTSGGQGIAGLGTVGSEVAKQLQSNSEFLNKKAGKKLNLVAVSANNKNKVRNFDISNLKWFPDAKKLANSKEISLVIELIGGSDGVALDLCKNSLIKGKSGIFRSTSE